MTTQAPAPRGGGRRAGHGHVWVVRITGALTLLLLVGAAARAVPTGLAGVVAMGDVRDWLAAVAFTVIGGRLAYRRSENPVGWLFLAVGVTAAASAFVAAFSVLGLPFSWLSAWLWWPAYGLLPLALMLFPDGRLPSHRWRWAAVLAVLGATVPTVGLALAATLFSPDFLEVGQVDASARPYLLLAAAGMVCAAAAAAAGVAALGSRWRHAADRDRRQLTWPLAAALAVLVGWVLESLGLPGAWILGGAAVPIAAAVAIARHGLYDLGALFSRTITYAIVTALLGGLYALIVVALTRAVTPVTGGIVPEAAAALTVAVLFQTVRRRVQERVDRRFNRARYDIALEVDGFTAHLRQHVELDSLSEDLLGVIDATVQPAQRSLWLRPASPAPTVTEHGSPPPGAVATPAMPAPR